MSRLIRLIRCILQIRHASRQLKTHPNILSISGVALPTGVIRNLAVIPFSLRCQPRFVTVTHQGFDISLKMQILIFIREANSCDGFLDFALRRCKPFQKQAIHFQKLKRGF
jgi:hypothetical protein